MHALHAPSYFHQLSARKVRQVLSEVNVVHVLVDETERLRLCRVHPHERYRFHISGEDCARELDCESSGRGITSSALNRGCNYYVPRQPERYQTKRSSDMTPVRPEVIGFSQWPVDGVLVTLLSGSAGFKLGRGCCRGAKLTHLRSSRVNHQWV